MAISPCHLLHAEDPKEQTITKDSPAEEQKEYGYAGAWRGHHTESPGVGMGACSLISPSWVITAAHVASKKADTPKKSNVEIKFGGETRTVDMAFCVEGTDLAIAHLSKPVTTITPVALCDQIVTKESGTFPITWASRGRGFKVIPGIIAKGDGERIIIGKDDRPGQSGDSGCGFVIDMPKGQNDLLVGVLHGSGLAPQPARFHSWIDRTMAAHSDEKVIWKGLPGKAAENAGAKDTKTTEPEK